MRLCMYDISVTQKKGLANYETLIKEVPRSQRDYFARMIIWEQGKGENSVQWQVNRVSSIISKELKISIEKKVAMLNEESQKIESEPLTFSKIAKLHVCKLKLLKIYEHLKMHSQATPMLMDEYQYICLNKFYFKNPTLNQSRNSTWNPSLINSEQVLEMLIREDIFLIEFMTHFYYQIFTHLCRTMKLIEALSFLKEFLSFIRSDVFEANPKPIQKVLQNIWLIQLVESSLIVVQAQKNLLTLSRKAQIDVIQAGLKLTVRDALEEIGFLLFGFNQSVFHALNVSAQVNYMLDKLKEQPGKESTQKILQEKKVQQGALKQKLQKIVNPQLRKTFESYGHFIKYYVVYLEEMLTILKETKLRRVCFYLSMTILKAKIEFPWIQITSSFVTEETREDIKNWKGLELLCAIYLTLYHHMNGRQDPFQSEIGLVLGNSVLPIDQRRSIMQLLQKQSEKNFNLVNYKIGKLSKVNMKESEYNLYQIQLTIETFFDFKEDLFDEIELTLVNSRLSTDNQIKVKFSGKEIQTKTKNQVILRKMYKTAHRQTLKAKDLIFINKNIVAPVIIDHTFKNEAHQLNGVHLSESWEFGNNSIYCHISTLFIMKMKGLKNCSEILIDYENQKALNILGASLDNQPFEISQHCKVPHTPTNPQSLFSLTLTSTISDPIFSTFPLTFTFVFPDYTQTVIHTFQYKTLPSFEVVYQGSDRLFQYNITNIIDANLFIESKKHNYAIRFGEEISTRSEVAQIGLREDIMKEIKLRDVCKNWQAIAKVRERFKIRLQTTKLKVFQQVKIESEEIGNIKVTAHEGYEMVGKVKGRVQYKTSGSKFINLKLIPVRKGKIVLPDILIQNKKGQWNCPIVLDVQ